MQGYSEIEREVLTRLQRGIEPVARPFEGMSLPAAAVVELIRRAQADGLMRRFGAVFDARRLGYKSVLCALESPAEEIAAKAEVVSDEPGVTHCYERRPLSGGNYPALWFTLALLHDEFEAGLERMRRELETPGSRLYELPALRRFKIDVVFDLRTVDRDETFPGAVPAAEFSGAEAFREYSETERRIVRAMDQHIPISETPFVALADSLGIAEQELLDTLSEWRRAGVLRRIAAVLRHREAGFKANAMCVWPVAGDILEVGRIMASQPEVTHCYQRPRTAAVPFDLYAMIHTESWDSTRSLFEDLTERGGLQEGEMFASLREFKKSSMNYFS